MTVKILVSAIGQHIIAGVRVVENQETQERVAYLLKEPRVIQYRPGEDGKTNLSLLPYCFASDENEFSISESHIVAVLEPREEIEKAYTEQVYPNEIQTVTPEIVED